MTDNWLQQGMEQEARRIEVRIPNMNSTEMNVFRGNVKDFLTKYDISQSQLAKKNGVSDTQISNFLAGKYSGDVKGLCAKLTDFINRYERRNRRVKESGYIETTVARAILTVIRNTESFSKPQEGRISLIVGDAGHGKSECLQQYAEQSKNSVYAKLNDTMSSAALFARIAEAMAIDKHGSLKTIATNIDAYLRTREMTVLIDEASSLSAVCLNQLRQIISENGSPLILAGNNHILETIRQPATRRGYESMDQFRSRLLKILDLDKLAAAGGKDGGLYTADDIRKLYEYGGLKLTGDGAGLLKRIAKTPQTGRLRTCSIIISAIHNSVEVKTGKINTIDSAIILSAIELLGLPVRDNMPMALTADAESQAQAEAKTA